MDRTTRQQLYDRIRQSSLDEVVLEEMIRHGFWSAKGDIQADPADEIRRRGELERELVSLRTEATRAHNVAALKREAHRKRLADAKQRREETKARREQARVDRAAAWAKRRGLEILYLGPEVSTALGDAEVNADRLTKYGVPSLTDAASVAAAMGITVGELRFLAFDRKVSKRHHYQRFLVPKKTGGERLISAPMPRLKAAQRWILDNVLAPLPVHDAAHGFVTGRSICTNAAPHVGVGTVVNLDLADFFPSVTWLRVRGLFTSLGLSKAAATVLALLCTEREVDEVELDGQVYFVARSERVLPQGSPASPAITNLLCRRLDARLAGLARKHGFAYTRYADDLTFSHPNADAAVGKILAACDRLVGDEGFVVHGGKTRVMRAGRRQEVTGVVVNDKPGVRRKELRKFRATLFQVERDGPAGKKWGHGGDLFTSLAGFASYVAMVDAEKGRPLVERVRALAKAHGHRVKRTEYPARVKSWESAGAADTPADAGAPTPSDTTDPDPASPPAKRGKWWQFWKE